MTNVIFVAPYFLEATERFIGAAANVPGVRLGLVSCDPVVKLKPSLRHRLAAHYAVPSIQQSDLLEGVKQLARQLGSVDRLLGMLEQIQVPLGSIRDQLKIPGMGATAANNFRDKSQMKNVLRGANFPCARHRLATTAAEASDFAQQIDFPLIVKPPDGAGAKGTFRCENLHQLNDCVASLHPSARSPVLIEEFIQGREHSFDSVFINGQIVWHSISHYFPGPLEVIREPWIQWCVIIPREVSHERYQAIERTAPAAIRELGMQTGLSHLEWFQRSDGSIAISEVGARPPGAQFVSLLSYAHDFDFYRGWAELMIFDRFQPPSRPYACGAAYLRGMGAGKVARVHGLDAIAGELGDLVVEAKIPQPGSPTSGSYEGEGFIIVRHPETRVVEDALDRIINSVRVELSGA